MKWEKKGMIFEPKQRYDWMFSHSQIPFPVDFGNFVRVYFATREAYRNGMCRSYGGFVDLDKYDLTKIIKVSEKPILSLGGIGEFDEFGVMPASVIKIKDKFYMYYCGWTRAVSTPHKEEIGIAVSEDGESFERIGRGPVIGDNLYEPYLHSYPVVCKFDDSDVYHMFYHTGVQWLQGEEKMEIQYLIRHATSKDGINWERDYKDIIETELEYESQTSPSVFKKDGLYHMLFCYRYSLDFRDKSNRGYKIGYAVSSDLSTWERRDGEAGIELSVTGWDSKMIEYPSVININGKYIMFYCGNEFGKQGFGYAELVE